MQLSIVVPLDRVTSCLMPILLALEWVCLFQPHRKGSWTRWTNLYAGIYVYKPQEFRSIRPFLPPLAESLIWNGSIVWHGPCASRAAKLVVSCSLGVNHWYVWFCIAHALPSFQNFVNDKPRLLIDWCTVHCSPIQSQSGVSKMNSPLWFFSFIIVL